MQVKTQGKNRQKFIELAEKRVNRAIKNLRLIGNLSNRSNYTYTDEEAEIIIRTLEGEIKALKILFARKPREKRPFTLKT